MTSKKKYQVFVSSTFQDLKDERQLIVRNLLTRDCIPVGMDLHPSDNAQWSQIKEIIDECDYYLLLVGGRYGSLSVSGVSYTHMEYTAAAAKNKPIIAYCHSNPTTLALDRQEPSKEGKLKLIDFKKLLEKHYVVPWVDEKSLEAAMERTLPTFILNNPSAGWVKAGSGQEIALMKENQALKQKVKELMDQQPEVEEVKSTRTLEEMDRAGGTPIHYSCKVFVKGDCKEAMCSSSMTWQEIFTSVAPSMLEKISETQMQDELSDKLSERALTDAQKMYPKAHAVRDIRINKTSFNTIKVQLRALGLIKKLTTKASDNMPYWQLTASGDSKMASLMTLG